MNFKALSVHEPFPTTAAAELPDVWLFNAAMCVVYPEDLRRASSYSPEATGLNILMAGAVTELHDQGLLIARTARYSDQPKAWSSQPSLNE